MRIALLVCSLALAPVCMADKAADALLAKMRAAYASIKTAEFQTESTAEPAPGRKVSLSIKGQFMAPNKVHAVTVTPAARAETFCDGKKILVLSGDQRKTADFNVQTLARNVPGNLETICLFDWKRQLSTGKGGNMAKSQLRVIPNQSWNGKQWTILEETAPEARLKVSYYVDPKTNLIWRSVIVGIKGNKVSEDARLVNLKLNGKIDPKVFSAPKSA